MPPSSNPYLREPRPDELNRLMVWAEKRRQHRMADLPLVTRYPVAIIKPEVLPSVFSALEKAGRHPQEMAYVGCGNFATRQDVEAEMQCYGQTFAPHTRELRTLLRLWPLPPCFYQAPALRPLLRDTTQLIHLDWLWNPEPDAAFEVLALEAEMLARQGKKLRHRPHMVGVSVR